MRKRRNKKEVEIMLRDILEMRRNGLTFRAIGSVFGISGAGVMYHLKKNEEYILSRI